ncbi:MAG: hypothetical protein ACRDN0_38260 [Trebonia sp.]
MWGQDRDDTFIGQLRAYHVAAARAHRDHSRPEVPMPVAVPVLVSATSAEDDYDGADGGPAGPRS